MKKIIIFLLIMSTSSYTYAGFNNLTHHSRANCGNNESISWDWTSNHYVKVISLHTPTKGSGEHTVTTEQNSWRIASVHWGEGHGGWKVIGQHWMKNNRGQNYLAAQETVSDCSIYDGWWDRNK